MSYVFEVTIGIAGAVLVVAIIKAVVGRGRAATSSGETVEMLSSRLLTTARGRTDGRSGEVGSR